MHVRTYVPMCVCMSVCLYVCKYIYICMYVCMYVSMCIYVYIYMYPRLKASPFRLRQIPHLLFGLSLAGCRDAAWPSQKWGSAQAFPEGTAFFRQLGCRVLKRWPRNINPIGSYVAICTKNSFFYTTLLASAVARPSQSPAVWVSFLRSERVHGVCFSRISRVQAFFRALPGGAEGI